MKRRSFLFGAFATALVGGSTAAYLGREYLGETLNNLISPEDQLEMDTDLAGAEVLPENPVLPESMYQDVQEILAKKGDRLAPSTRWPKGNRVVSAEAEQQTLPEQNTTIVQKNAIVEEAPVVVAKPEPVLTLEEEIARNTPENVPIPTFRRRDKDKTPDETPVKPRTRFASKREDDAEKPAKSGLHMPSLFRLARNTIVFYNTHIDEKVKLDFSDIDTDAFDYFMRDVRAGKEKHVAKGLAPHFGLVVGYMRKHGASVDEWELISGFRTPETNQMLQSRNCDPKLTKAALAACRSRSGVASGSLHIKAFAMDIRARNPHVRLRDVHEAAVQISNAQNVGGVGFYPGKNSNFVHIDVGPRRNWG